MIIHIIFHRERQNKRHNEDYIDGRQMISYIKDNNITENVNKYVFEDRVTEKLPLKSHVVGASYLVVVFLFNFYKLL